LDLEQVQQKFAEAHRSLAKMTERERQALGELFKDEQRLYELLRQGRHDEAHIARKSRPARKAGLKLCVGHEDIKVGVGAPYSDRSCRGESFGSETIRLALGINTDVILHKDTYNFNIDGNQRKATEVCAAYPALLERMPSEVITAIERGEI
jgi:hypothetical protein